MRILITGMTPTQCGRPGRFQWLVVPALFAEALRKAGHEVEHRACTPNEDLTPYDVILVGLVPPGSIAARHVYVTSDVICRAKASGATLMFYVDDWQYDKIMSGCRNKHKHPHGMYTTIKGRTHRDWAETEEGRQRVALAMQALATRPWPPTLSVAFPWGDHGKISKMPSVETIFVDPSPLCWPKINAMHQYRGDQLWDEDRQRRWVLASLSNHQEWVQKQQFEWPVELIGPKQTGATYTLKEHEIVDLVSHSWGALCPPYHHAGSGWWRPRYLYTASAGAVAHVSAEDAAYLGDAYQLDHHQVERMTVPQLTEVQRAQTDALIQHTWSVDQLVETLDATLKAHLVNPVKQPATMRQPVPELEAVPDKIQSTDSCVQPATSNVQPTKEAPVGDDAGDWLGAIYSKQLGLQEQLGYDFWAMSGQERVEYVRMNILALENELHEALAETTWKPWATYPEQTIGNERKFGDELVDALHFLMNLFIVAGWTPQIIHERFMVKNKVNQTRQETGYDATSAKCAYSRCRRHLDDPTANEGIVLLDGKMWCNDGCYDAWYDEGGAQEAITGRNT